MIDEQHDLSFATSSSIDPIDIPIKNLDLESSLDSYGNLFDRGRHNFSASSEISCINPNNENSKKNLASPINHNRTFTKEISKTMINAFTGKPISPNPWRKLCTKNIQYQTEANAIVPIEIFPKDSTINLANQDKIVIQQEQFSNKTETHQSHRDISNNQETSESNNDDNNDDLPFKQSLEQHQNPTIAEPQHITSLGLRRKKMNNLQDFNKDSSSSSDENIKECSSDFNSKTNRLINKDPSWQRLADIYTSEESDESNHLLLANNSLTVRLKSEIYTSDQSTESSSRASSSSSLAKASEQSSIHQEPQAVPFNFLESLSECILFEDKHPDAKPYFILSAFKLKVKRQELANKLLSIFNQDIFSSQLTNKISVIWSARLTATAGHCTTRRKTGTAIITLSHKICDSPERCRDTLLHEMCHAAVTLIDGVMEQGHGPLWRQWTRIAEQCYPYLPSITVKHTYDVSYKFIYRCIQCEHEVYRHSKSLNLDLDLCGKCMGRFELTLNCKQNQVTHESPSSKKVTNKYNLYVKENFPRLKQANPNLSTPQLMKQLSIEYKERKQQQAVDLPDLDQLKL